MHIHILVSTYLIVTHHQECRLSLAGCVYILIFISINIYLYRFIFVYKNVYTRQCLRNIYNLKVLMYVLIRVCGKGCK